MLGKGLGVIRCLAQLLSVLLFMAFGVGFALAKTQPTDDLRFSPVQISVTDQCELGWFDVRGPPLAVSNIAITGGVAVMHGGGAVVHGQETVAALFGFDGDFNATNRIPIPDDLPTTVHMGQQGKHMRGHNNFIEGRSYFNDGVDPSDLLAGVHNGQYPIVGTGSRGNPIVDFGRPIGIDGRTGQPVSRGQIHYGSKGAHIVPDSRN